MEKKKKMLEWSVRGFFRVAEISMDSLICHKIIKIIKSLLTMLLQHFTLLNEHGDIVINV